MIVPIDKVIVKDRIRKDFGDIQELADDIRQNGLINPPVVNKEYELLAGERRLRACKALGMKEIEVRVMDTRDAEHELNVEISENENRKAFSKSERADYMKRLFRIEQAKAKERQDLGLKSDEGSRADDSAAKQFGLGRDTMRKEFSIVDNKDLLSPEDFADWDEGRLSTNKAFQKIKAREKQLEAENRELEDYITHLEQNKKEANETLSAEISSRDQKINELLEELNNVEPLTVTPPDYNELKKKAKTAEAYRQDYKREQEKVTEKQREILALKDRIAELEGATMEGLDSANLSENIFYFCCICNNFIGNVGGLVWLTDRIADMPAKEKDMFLKAARSFMDWSMVFKQNLERSMANEQGNTGTVTGIPALPDKE